MFLQFVVIQENLNEVNASKLCRTPPIYISDIYDSKYLTDEKDVVGFKAEIARHAGLTTNLK